MYISANRSREVEVRERKWPLWTHSHRVSSRAREKSKIQPCTSGTPYASESTQQPRRIIWVTGPAGCGKTAIMGSLSVRCASHGILGATFFFASWSASVGRRRKTALITTIAHQLARYHPHLREEISKAIDADSDIFDKNLHVQMEVLILGPLRNIARRPDGPGLRGAIIIDGLDECEAEQYHDTAATGSRSKSPPPRKHEQDQLEIL